MFILDVDVTLADARELICAAACVLVFLSFFETDMKKLRVFAILSNVFFVTYAASRGLVPILILHSTLLPLNIFRLIQLNRAVNSTA